MDDILVVSCIDFRTVEKQRTLLRSEYALGDGDYYLLATAGAALNPDTYSLITQSKNPPARVINNDHRDCGYAKSTGGDSQERHEKEMADFGKKLEDNDKDIDYQANIIPMEEPDLARHECKAVVIMIGDPLTVQQAREKLDALGFTDEHDEIARPYALSPDDQTLWKDLVISLNLHHPQTIFIFASDEDNAGKLARKAQSMAKDAKVETVLVPKA